MFASSAFEVVLPAENREGSLVGYASHRKLDKRIILITRWFRSSRSTWWSARSPLQLFSAHQPSVQTHERIHQSSGTSQAVLFSPFLKFYSGADLTPLRCFISEQEW